MTAMDRSEDRLEEAAKNVIYIKTIDLIFWKS